MATRIIPTRLIRSTLAALGIVLATATTASAASWSHFDALIDVTTTSNGWATTSPAPAHLSTDVIGVRAVNGARTITVTVHTFSALPAHNYLVTSTFRTPTGRFSATRVDSAAGNGKAVFARNVLVDCDDLSITVDRLRRLVRYAIPSSCLGDPAWIRFGTSVVTSNAADTVEWFDDALRADMGSGLALSPRIARG
ncbi:hypothetical protein [Nocardioides montaniterrae]